MFLEPTEAFFQLKDESIRKNEWSLLLNYFHAPKKSYVLLIVTILLSALAEFSLPGITKNIVDKGINQKNLSFIEILILAQFALLLGKIISEFIRNKVLLTISNTIIVKILSAFWSKLMQLPLRFFDTRNTGDIMQRNYDNERIKEFLTEHAFGALYSIFTFIVFTIILINYNFSSSFIFLTGTLLYFAWIFYFLKKRRALDNERFEVSAKEQDVIFEMIQGMHEIKLYNCETRMQQKWLKSHTKGMINSVKSLKVSQVQSTGSFIINELKNALITLVIAKSVIDGNSTLGTLLATTFILGQLQAPIEDLIIFIQHGQNVKLSLKRINEINLQENEEKESFIYNTNLEFTGDIKFENVSFSYDYTTPEKTLKNINLIIPAGKITAIVGTSGSGKTTMLKMLLHYFDKYEGTISISKYNFMQISPFYWRSKCSSVMQNSFIFNDTIEQNIALNNEEINNEALVEACKIANIYDFIMTLPLGFKTKIGDNGLEVSQGQRQRILIARTIYKDPQYIFFDEATNSLDANNERLIIENLNDYFRKKDKLGNQRTVIFVAHRLSTVQNADKIVVIEDGRVVEEGNHESLIRRNGNYYQLVKNQLELNP